MSLVNMQGKFIVKAGGAGGGGGISAPSNVSISSKTSSGFTVSWNAVASALGYKLDVATDSGFSSFVTGYNGKDVAGTSQAVTGLTQNTTYYVRVRAVATGSNSGSVSDTTETATLPLNAGLRSGLQAFYKLDDTTDASGNGNTLTNTGGVTFSSGKIGNAADFSGNSPYLSRTGFNIGNTFTLSTWINVSSLSPSYIGLLIQSGDIAMYTTPNGAINFGDFSSWSASSNSNTIMTNNWHHIALVSDNGSVTLFVDNNAVANDSAHNVTMDASNIFKINGDSGGSDYALKIDAVGIWNRALTESEVTELYNSGSGLE